MPLYATPAMKLLCCILFGLLMGACARNRALPGPPAPVDEAEYYSPGVSAAEVGRRKLLPDPINGLGQTNDPNIRLTDIRQTSSYTVLYLTFSLGDPRGRDYTYSSATSEISIQSGAVLMPFNSRDTYKLVKATGIPLSPNTQTVRGHERVDFVLYFERLPDAVEQFAMFECKDTPTQTCWNITGMRLQNAPKP